VGAFVLLLAGSTFLLSQRSQQGGQGGGKGGGRGRGGGGATPVGVATVTKGDMGVFISALGTVTPVYTATVTSRVVGELMSIHYREGQIVQKGDLLAEIDSRPYQATLTQAEGQLQRDRAVLKNAYIDLDRYKMIYAEKAIPQQTLATQEATVEQNEGSVRVDQGNLDAAKVNIEYTRIRAPITGRVGLRLVDPGNIVQANGTTGIVTITQLQPITVVFTMAEDYLSEVMTEIRKGHPLRVDALDRGNQEKIAQGKLLTVDNSIDVNTGTVRARATFANKDGELFPNEFVNTRLLVRTLHQVDLIPTSAIQRNADQAYVYVIAAGNTVKARNIQVVNTDANSAAVTGVNPGERLVTDGFDRLQNGAKVSIRGEGPVSPDNRSPTPQQQESNDAEGARSRGR
jgi:membrane fusion protein, multidrug efflux system